MLCHLAPVRTDVSEERIASITRVTRIDELGTAFMEKHFKRVPAAKNLQNSYFT
jgi:hypothetical protein